MLLQDYTIAQRESKVHTEVLYRQAGLELQHIMAVLLAIRTVISTPQGWS